MAEESDEVGVATMAGLFELCRILKERGQLNDDEIVSVGDAMVRTAEPNDVLMPLLVRQGLIDAGVIAKPPSSTKRKLPGGRVPGPRRRRL